MKNTRTPILATLALTALARQALGVITINADATDQSAPPNGAPWNYVAELSDGFGPRASGVYLGNGYILTANHIDTDINSVFLDNVTYGVDSSFTPVAISGTDMRIIRLSAVPGLPVMPLISGSENPFNQSSTMIGWGVGKGTVVTNQGWNWADNTTHLERWGSNITSSSYNVDPSSGISYLTTNFDITLGATTGQLTEGDSGGGLFEQFGGVWTLVGVNAGVTTNGQALYDNDPNTAGNQPDQSFFASVAQFTAQIEAITGTTTLYWNNGSGTWNSTLTNWATSGGSSSKWMSGTAIFQGTGGTVTLASALSAQTLIFSNSGFTIAGTSTLTLNGGAPEIDVTNAGDSATIGVPLAGTQGLIVGGAGTLILTSAANNYTGTTSVDAGGTLQLGTAAAAAKLNTASAVSLSQGSTLSLVNVAGNTFANNVSTGSGGGILNIASANTITLSGALTDDGTNALQLNQSGTGTTILTNAHNTYSGATNISGGTLQVGTATVAGSIGTSSAIKLSNNAGLTLTNVSGNTLANNIDHTTAGASTITANAAGIVTLSGTISNTTGTVAVVLNNANGALIINNPNNSYTGGTILNNGILIVDGDPNTGLGTPLGTGPLTINGGILGTNYAINYGDGVTITNPIAINANFSIAPVSYPAVPGAQNITIAGAVGGTVDLNGATRTITGVTSEGQVHFGAGGIIDSKNQGAGLTLSTSFTNAGNYVAFILDASNSNTYTGLTTVKNDAILVFEGTSNSPVIQGNVDIENNGALDFLSAASNQLASTAVVTDNSTGTTVGSVALAGFDLFDAYSQTIATLNGKGTVFLAAATLTVGNGNFTGKISDGGHVGSGGNPLAGGSLIKTTAGTLTLGGVNSYTGVTDIEAGALVTTVSGALPQTSAIVISNGATLDLDGFKQSVGSLSDGSSTGGTVSLGAAALTTGFNNSNTTFSGVIQDGGISNGKGGSLTKVGTGTFALTGANTYSGATNITGGTLEVDGSLAAASTVNVGTAGTLAGSGTINGKATLTGNGTINLNNGTIAGPLTITGGNWTGNGTVSNLVTASSGTFTIGNGATLVANAGLNVTGGALLGTGTLKGNLSYTSSVSGEFDGVIANGANISSVTMNKAGVTLTLAGVNTYSGATTVNAGTLQIGNSSTGNLSNSSGVTVNGTGVLALQLGLGVNPFTVPIVLNGAGTQLKALSTENVVTGLISGTGSVVVSNGNLTLQNDETYTGATTVAGGILEVDDSIGANSVVTIGAASNLTGMGTIKGKVNLTGGGNIDLTAPASILGTLTVTGGSWSGDGSVGSLVTVSSGNFAVSGNLTAATGGVAVTGGTLTGTGTITGSVNYTSSLSSTFGGVITGGVSSVTVNKTGSTLILTGGNTYSGATNIMAGTLQLGDGVTAGATLGAGNITVTGMGALAIDLADGETFSQNVAVNATGATVKAVAPGMNTITGIISGVGGFAQNGTGTTILKGGQAYAGATSVNTGTLQVDGSLAAASTVNVAAAGTLSGTGTIPGTVNILSGGTISAGDPSGPGTLTVGKLVLNAGSNSNFRLDTAGTVGGGVNDLVNVTGNLTLGGTLNVTQLTNFGIGIYTLYTYGGTLTGTGFSAVNGTGGYTTSVVTGVSGKVELVVSAQGFATQYWDGARTVGNNAIGGGSGTWNNATTNWTDNIGATNSAWQGGTAVFDAPGGTVTLGAPVNAQALIFGASGYTITGTTTNVLNLVGAASGSPTISVTSANTTATIAAPITGNAGLVTGGLGTTIFTSSANSYSGGTRVENGTLQIGTTSATGSIGSGTIAVSGGVLNLVNIKGNALANNITNGLGNAGTVQINSTLANTVSGVLTDGATGTLALAQGGTGTTTLTNSGNTFSGGTTISKGTLQVGTTTAAGSVGSGAISVSSGGTLTLTNLTGQTLTNSISNAVSGTGTVVVNSTSNNTLSGSLSDNTPGILALTQSGTGTTTLNGAVSYSGATKITAGTLQLGDGTNGTFAGNGAFTLSGTSALALDLANSPIFTPNIGLSATTTKLNLLTPTGTTTISGVISGTGSVNQIGAGTTVLSGVNTYTGPTNITGGTLAVSGSTAVGSIVNVGSAGTLAGNGKILGKATVTGSGIINLGAAAAIGGTLGVTGGEWKGNGVVNGLVTVSSNIFTIDSGATLTANAGLALTGGSLAGTGSLAGSLTDTSSSNFTFGGTITGNNSSVTMNKASATLVLTGASNYGKGTTVTAGTLQVGDGTTAGATLGSGVVTTATTGTLTMDLASGESFNNAVTDNGHVNATGTANNYGILGVISGTGNLTKTGTNTVALNNANTYKGGTAVGGGTLLVNNTAGSGTGTGAVTVNNGGTLGGSGFITGAVTLNGGGTLFPSASGTAGTTLHAASMMWNGGGTLTLQLGPAGDELVLTGALTKGSAGNYTVNIEDAGLVANTTYTLATFASTTFAATNFTLTLPSGDTGTLSETSTSLLLNVTAVGAHSESVAQESAATQAPATDPSSTFTDTTTASTFTPTPEPTSGILLTLGGVSLLGWRRRRRAR